MRNRFHGAVLTSSTRRMPPTGYRRRLARQISSIISTYNAMRVAIYFTEVRQVPEFVEKGLKTAIVNNLCETGFPLKSKPLPRFRATTRQSRIPAIIADGRANKNHRTRGSSPGFKRTLSKTSIENQRLAKNPVENEGLSRPLDPLRAGFAIPCATDPALVLVHHDDFQGHAKNTRQNDCE